MSRGAATEVETGRFDVRSADGTSIAVWVEGSGPPLVLVHGSLTDHTTFAPLVAAGDLETAMPAVLAGIVGLAPEEVAALRRLVPP